MQGFLSGETFLALLALERFNLQMLLTMLAQVGV